MKKRNSRNEQKYMVPALERGMRILELLSEYPAGLSMTGMGKLELPPASLYRMLVTLTELGYLVHDDNDTYRLGRKLLKLGYRSIDESSLVENALGSMRELRDLTGETVLLGVLHHHEGIVLESVKSHHAVCVSVRIGHHYPLHSAAPGKAMMAFLPESERDALLKRIDYTAFTGRTLKNADELRRELAQVREDGVAYDRGEELSELRCVSSPVCDENNYPVAAVWIAGPESRLDGRTMKKYAPSVRECANKIREKLIH